MINENGFISGEELDALKDADIDFWVSNLIEKDSLTLISAPKGLGKSWFLLSLGTAVSSGDNFLITLKRIRQMCFISTKKMDISV